MSVESVNNLLERLSEISLGTIMYDWQSIRGEIHELKRNAETTQECITLINAYNTTMDFVEKDVIKEEDDNLEKFRITRKKDYWLLLSYEYVSSDGNVIPERFLEVSDREIAAGRLDSDEEVLKIRSMAEEMLKDRNKKSVGILRRFLSVMGSRR